MSAGAVRAGGVFVEIGADPRKFFSALNKVNKSLANMGGQLVSGGGKLTAAGIGMAAPIVAAVRQGARFESTLLNIRASTGATASEIDRIKASAMQMSQALGVGPTEAAGGMLELLKAGMRLDAVLGGAGQAALQFAKVGEMDVAQAAVVMSDAMNVFGVSGTHAANTLSAAADASSTSITQMAEAFSMSSAVAGLANQSIDDLSATLAILANSGVKGSDAGTSVKTMLMRLMAPAEDAAAALADVGLSTQSFRGADGKMLPMVQIIGSLNGAMQSLDQTAKDDIFRRIFGADAIRAASILSSVGVDGFSAMRESMASALSVADKFRMMMSGLAGAGQKVLASLERLAIAISDAVGPALSGVAPFVSGLIDSFAAFVSQNKEAVAVFAKFAVSVIAVGSAMTTLGLSFQATAFGMAGLGKAVSLVLSPFSMMSRSALFVAKSFKNVVGELGGAAASGIGSVLKFAAATGVGMARASAGFGALAVDAILSGAKVAAAMSGTALAGVVQFVQSGIAQLAQYTAKSTALVAVSSARFGAMGAAQVAATVSVISATVARAAEGNVRAAAIGVQALARLGVAGTTNALIAGAQVARLTSQGSTQLLRLGVTGSTSLATIGTTALSVGANTAGALATATAAGGGSLSRMAAAGVQGLTSIGTSAATSGTAIMTSVVKAASAGISQAGALSLAWLGGLARMTAASALSGVAMAAALVAPFAAIAAAIGLAGVVAYQFKDQIGAAFSAVGSLVSQVAGSVGSVFMTAFNDAIAVFSDLYSIASTTFSGIYDAIVAGDLSGAMQILWAGLQAGWLRGVEALMSYVDPFTSLMQNTFTYLSATVMTIWDGMVNGMAASWDAMESSVRKGWNFLNAAFQGADQTAVNDVSIDREMRDRATRRATGTVDRTAAANAITAAREEENRKLAEGRRVATADAEQRLASMTAGAASKRADIESIAGIQDALSGVTNMSDLGGIGQQIAGLIDRNSLSAAQESQAMEAYRAAQQRLAAEVSPASAAGGPGGGIVPPETESKTSIAGTFSSVSLGQSFGGGSAAERTARAAEETAKGVKELVAQGGGKVAA